MPFRLLNQLNHSLITIGVAILIVSVVRKTAGKVIHVKAFDESGKLIFEYHVSSDKLPSTFDTSTVLQGDDCEFQVLKADYPTREDYERSRELNLVVRKSEVSFMDPDTVPISYCTIAGKLPVMEPNSTRRNKRYLVLFEDDWMQLQLTGYQADSFVSRELANIEDILKNSRRELGAFPKSSVRKGIEMVLAGTGLTVSDLKAAFPFADQLDGIAFREQSGLVDGGFVLDMTEFCLYGTQLNDEIEECGLVIFDSEIPDARIRALSALCSRYSLSICDWQDCMRISSDQIAAWIQSYPSQRTGARASLHGA